MASYGEQLLVVHGRAADALERIADELKALRLQAHRDFEASKFIPMGVFKEAPPGGVPDLATLRHK